MADIFIFITAPARPRQTGVEYEYKQVLARHCDDPNVADFVFDRL
jgi:hypothetical protein